MSDFEKMQNLVENFSRQVEQAAISRSKTTRMLPLFGPIKEYNLNDLVELFFDFRTSWAFTRVDWEKRYIQINNRRGYPFIQLVEKGAGPLQSLDMELQPYWGWIRYRRSFFQWLRGCRERKNKFEALKGMQF
jgi:hypothetical protein